MIPTRCHLLALLLAAAPAALTAQGTGVAAGIVRDSSGKALGGVDISLPGSPLRVTSADDGRFRLTGLPSGIVTLRARRLGYHVTPVAVTIGAPGSESLEVMLRAVPIQLDTILVAVQSDAHTRQLAAFYDRRSRGQGRFFTRSDLEHSQVSRMSDALRSLVPGMQVRNGGPRSSVRLRNARCAPLVWIDGAPAESGEFDVDAIDPSTVSAIEVYSGPATVPMEFRVNRGTDACGVIAIWSRNDYAEDVLKKRREAEKRRREAEARGDTGRVYRADEVDLKASAADDDLVAPTYPDSLRAFGVSGHVVVEFIVEDNGVVNAKSLEMVSTTHPEFYDAVRTALLASRFVPARKQGKPVRQVVMMPFDFRASKSY